MDIEKAKYWIRAAQESIDKPNRYSNPIHLLNEALIELGETYDSLKQ